MKNYRSMHGHGDGVASRSSLGVTNSIKIVPIQMLMLP